MCFKLHTYLTLPPPGLLIHPLIPFNVSFVRALAAKRPNKGLLYSRPALCIANWSFGALYKGICRVY